MTWMHNPNEGRRPEGVPAALVTHYPHWLIVGHCESITIKGGSLLRVHLHQGFLGPAGREAVAQSAYRKGGRAACR